MMNRFGGATSAYLAFLLLALYANVESAHSAASIRKFKVQENLPAGSFVGRVSTTNDSSSDSYEIDIASPTARAAFAVDSEGLLQTRMTLDKESIATYKFSLIVRSSKRPGRVATIPVEVDVTDVNDNAPVFSQSEYVFSLKENMDYFEVIGRLKATDSDSGDNGDLYCWVQSISKLDDTPFAVSVERTKQHRVIALRPLDREKQSVYRFYVLAEDAGRPRLTSTALVTVLVEDENDNAPEWIWPSPESPAADRVISVSRKNLMIGLIVFRSVASDADQGDFARIRYSIDVGSRNASAANFLGISRDTGNVYVTNMPPSAGVDRYELTLVASDGEGSTSHHSMVDIVVNLMP